MEVSTCKSTEGLIHVSSAVNENYKPDNVQLPELVAPQKDSNQERTAPLSPEHERDSFGGHLFQKVLLVLTCIFVIIIVWVLFFTLVAITFAVNQSLSSSSNSPDPFNLNTSTPQTPVARVTILNIFNDRLDLYLERSDLVLASNGMNLTGNVTIPVDRTALYHSVRYRISYYAQVVTGVPKVYFTPSIVRFSFSTSSVNNSVNNVSLSSNTLLATFSSNKLDSFNITVDCPDGFFYSDSFCQLSENFCDEYHPSGNAGRIILRVGLILLAVFGLLVSIISLLTFIINLCTNKSGGFESNFFKKLFESLVTPSLFSLFVFAFFCVILFVITDLPNPDLTFCKELESTADFVLFNMYGAIFQFMLIGFLFWVNFTLLNLLLIVSFPFTFNSTSRMKNYVFLIESIIAIALPILFAIITLASRRGRAYVGLQFVGLIGPTGIISLLFLYAPVVLSCISILTLTPLILCKMRWNSLRTTGILDKYPKATPLEYRIAVYSIVLAVLLIILMTGYIFFIRVSQSEDYFSLVDIGLCATYRSPASLYRNNVQTRFSSTAQALKSATNSTVVPLDFMLACDRVDATNRAYPPGLYILDTFLIRIVVSCVFIITLPTHANYQTWKNIFFRCTKRMNLSSSTKVTSRN